MSGVGKTTLAGTSADVVLMRDILLINAEGGDLSIADKDIQEVGFDNFKALQPIHQFLQAHCRYRDNGDDEALRTLQDRVFAPLDDGGAAPLKRFRTVIVDSLTEVEARCMNQLLGITDRTRLDEESESAEWSEYKKNHTMMLRVVREFRDLPMHVIFICGRRYTTDETRKHKYSLDLTGQLALKVQGFVDMVGYYTQSSGEDNKVERRLYVMPSTDGRYDAKHRYSAFKGQYFKDPTIGSILNDVNLL